MCADLSEYVPTLRFALAATVNRNCCQLLETVIKLPYYFGNEQNEYLGIEVFRLN